MKGRFKVLCPTQYHYRIMLIVMMCYSVLIITDATVVRNIQLPRNELPDYNATQFAALNEIVGLSELVNFGESSHYLAGMHHGATRMFRYLVEKKDFRVFVFESAWAIDEAMQVFLASNRTKITASEQYLLNAFHSTHTTELLLWIREFNQANPNDPIRLAGYQPEQPVTDFNALWDLVTKSSRFVVADYLPKFDACKIAPRRYETDFDFALYTFEQRKKGQPIYTVEERAACNQFLDALENFIAENRQELMGFSSLAYQEARAHLISWRTYLNRMSWVLDYLTTHTNISQSEKLALGQLIYEEGDKARFEIFQILFETRYKAKKVMFWMHNWHAMKNAPQVSYGFDIPKGTISIGTRLALTYPFTQYVVIGSVVACPKCKSPMREDALEVPFSAILGQGSAIVDLRNPAPQHQNLPLTSPRSSLVQIDETHLLDVVLNQQFDAVYFLSESKTLFEE